MDVFLEVSAGLGRAHRAQFVDRGFQQFSDVFLDLFADAGFLEGSEKFLILNVGESAAQRTFHDVVVDHGSPSRFGDWARKGPLEPVECRWGYLKPEGVDGQ